MKIRIGFVSNSSSSSFIIIGTRLNCKESREQAEELISKGKLYAYAGDEYDSEGADFFLFTKEMLDSYEKYGPKSHIYFYNVQCMFEEPGKIKKDEIEGDDFNIFCMEISYHICQTLEEFQERHLDMPGDAVPEEIIDKAQQIKKLQEELKADGYSVAVLQNRSLNYEG